VITALSKDKQISEYAAKFVQVFIGHFDDFIANHLIDVRQKNTTRNRLAAQSDHHQRRHHRHHY